MKIRNGLTIADLVFPWFIWIMGTSMALSFDKLNRSSNKKIKKRQLSFRILKRSVILFCLGFFLINNAYDYANCRIPGVLQRFGVCFFVVAHIAVYVPKISTQNAIFQDIIPNLY